MKMVKEFLKKNRLIVFLYESIWGRVYHVKKKIILLRKRLFTKTHFSYGNKNKDKTFFVITSDGVASGIYSTIFYILPFVEYAIKKKYIPVVDFSRTYLPLIHDEKSEKLDNAWEYYYQQPASEFTLGEVYQSKNVILMVDSVFKVNMPNWNDLFPAEKNVLEKWSKYIEKYVRLTLDMDRYVEEEYERLRFSKRKVMGVGVRAAFRAGMMRNESLFNGHPKVPTCEEIMDIVEQKMKVWNCDSIFLSCDDREYCEKIKRHFGDKCLYIDRRLTHYFENDVPILPSDKKYLIEKTGYSVRELTEEYIVETYLLAKCNSLYSCIGGGAEFAYFVNGGKYEHLEVYNEGMYEGLGN